jgi:hypothetical protein
MEELEGLIARVVAIANDVLHDTRREIGFWLKRR